MRHVQPWVRGFLLGLIVMSLALAAAQETARRTILEVQPLGTLALGTPIDLDIKLTNTEDEAQGNKVLEIYLDGVYQRRARTEDDGTASVRVRDLPIGSYTLEVGFIGTQDYLPASATVPLTVRPALLTVETVPPLPGIPFALDGQKFLSDDQGVARLEITTLGAYQLAVLLEPEAKLSAHTRASFLRWADSEFEPERIFDIRGDEHLTVGFALSHRVQTRFFDLDKDAVPWSRVSALKLKGSNGTYRTLTDGEPHWLQANRVQRLSNGMVVAPLQYSVESVTLDGANVVNRYQQRFFVEPRDLWKIELLLYSASINATDALFGFSVGKGVSMTYPDGRTETLAFGSDDKVHVGPLARGIYQLQVTGASGIAPPTPVALSRDQEVELKVLSALDIGAGVSLGLFLALGLLFYGRPQLLGLGRRRAAPASLDRDYTNRRLSPGRGHNLYEGEK